MRCAVTAHGRIARVVAPLVVGVAAWGSTACKSEPLVVGGASPDASGAQTQVSEKDLHDRGRSVMDGALELTKSCRLRTEGVDALNPGGQVFDVCTWKDGEIEGFVGKADSLSSLAEGKAAPPELPARAFLHKARLFRDWMELARRTRRGRGTLALYQELATAWNDWQPAEKVPVDPPDVLHQYFERMDDESDNYLSKYGPYKYRKERGTPLVWRQGVNGLQLPF